MSEYESVLGRAREFFDTGTTRAVEFRTKVLRRLARTIEAGGTRRIALAFWSGEEDGNDRLLLEACRAAEEGAALSVGLADLWALPTNGGDSQPRIARQSDGGETVLISLPCKPDPGAPIVAQRWGNAFRDRYILHVRDLLFDHERCRAYWAHATIEAARAL